MKITDPDIIRTGEMELIDAIREDLDLEAVRRILTDKIRQTRLSASGGEIVVHDNQIAFRLDFDLNLSGSLMFDRDGNYISQAPDQNGLDLPEPDLGEDDRGNDPEPAGAPSLKAADDPGLDDPGLDDPDPEETDLATIDLDDPDGQSDTLQAIEADPAQSQEDSLPEPPPGQDPAPGSDLSGADHMDDVLRENQAFWETDE